MNTQAYVVAEQYVSESCTTGQFGFMVWRDTSATNFDRAELAFVLSLFTDYKGVKEARVPGENPWQQAQEHY